jgi:methyl-accepting chemotaxis protein
MTAGVDALRNRARWLTIPLAAAMALGAGFGLSCIVVMVQPGPREVTQMALSAVAIGIVIDRLADRWRQRHLTAVAGLADRSLEPSAENLGLGLAQLLAAPELSALTLVVSMLAGWLGWALVLTQLSAIQQDLIWSGAVSGMIVTPATGALAYSLVLPRARFLRDEFARKGLAAPWAAVRVATSTSLVPRAALCGLIVALTPLALAAEMAHVATSGLAGPTIVGTASRDVALIVVCLCCAALIGVLMARLSLLVSEPIVALANEADRLHRGTAPSTSFIAAEFETAGLIEAMFFVERQLADSSMKLAGAAGGMSTILQDLATQGTRTGPAQQQSALSATSLTTGELARSAGQIAFNAQRVSDLARQTLSAARTGQSSAEAFIQALQQVRDGNQAIADSVVRLNKRVQQVGRLIEFIDGIADKSDLLAINAELQGYKAGDVGRGFSLVAAEMRRLSESVMQSTREIGRLIDEIRDATNAAVMATEAGVKTTDRGASLAQKVADGLARIVEFANRSSEAMHSISMATGQQQTGTDALVNGMRDMMRSSADAIDNETAMVLAQTELAALVGELKSSVGNPEAKP